MPNPHYPHKTGKYLGMEFKGDVLLEGKPWDVWVSHPTKSIVFRYGPEPADYYGLNFRELPLEGKAATHDNALPTKAIDEAWRQAREGGMVF